MLDVSNWTHVWVLLVSLLLLTAMVAAIISTIRSSSLNIGEKALWVLVLLIPAVGLVLWAPFWWRRRALTAESSTQ